MNNKRYHLIINLVGILYYLAVALVLLIFFLSNSTVIDEKFLLILMTLTAIPTLARYFLLRQFNHYMYLGHIIWSVSFLIACLILFLVPNNTIATVCIIWGAFDIVKGLDELFVIFSDRKFILKEIPNAILAIMDVVLGIILIIKVENGLNVHLLAATISVFVYMIEDIVRIFTLKEISDEQD